MWCGGRFCFQFGTYVRACRCTKSAYHAALQLLFSGYAFALHAHSWRPPSHIGEAAVPFPCSQFGFRNIVHGVLWNKMPHVRTLQNGQTDSTRLSKSREKFQRCVAGNKKKKTCFSEHKIMPHSNSYFVHVSLFKEWIQRCSCTWNMKYMKMCSRYNMHLNLVSPTTLLSSPMESYNSGWVTDNSTASPPNALKTWFFSLFLVTPAQPVLHTLSQIRSITMFHKQFWRDAKSIMKRILDATKCSGRRGLLYYNYLEIDKLEIDKLHRRDIFEFDFSFFFFWIMR